jgi:hypothetical protein
MTLKAWLKGLAVFVVSSLITALAATSLDPAQFNFSRQGAIKLGTLVLVIAVKAVFLYFRNSPLAVDASGKLVAGSSKAVSMLLLCVLLPSTVALSGCVNGWERSTYATLTASKAMIDCAIAGYNGFDADIRHYCAADPADPAFDPKQFHIPQTRQAQQAIEAARRAQIAAVQVFEAYAVAKVAHDPSVSLAAKESAVINEVARLPELIGAIRALFTNAPSGHAKLPVRVPSDSPNAAAIAQYMESLKSTATLEAGHGK